MRAVAKSCHTDTGLSLSHLLSIAVVIKTDKQPYSSHIRHFAAKSIVYKPNKRV